MLARRRSVDLNGGAAFETPRLVPSFSSKGFPFFKERDTRIQYSDVTHALELMAPFIRDSLLISAYDLYHKFLRHPDRFFSEVEAVFIDSGGYELSPEWDSTEPKQGLHQAKRFTEENYREVLARLPREARFIVTNFDWGSRRKKLEDQILAAQQLFNDFPFLTRNFLIKPGNRRYLNMDEIVVHVGKLRSFHVIGVTEKELGHNLLDRLENLAKLRAAMDRGKVSAPIHVWGGLDPVITPLYFFSGAEIFDGVSWLRYAYREGTAVYRDCYGPLKQGIEISTDHARALTLNENIVTLNKLTTSLRRFVDAGGGDFDMFQWHRESFRQAYSVLATKVVELRRS